MIGMLQSVAVRFKLRNYQDWTVYPGDVVYLDPPYAGTTGYGHVGQFDHTEFWKTASAWRELGASVYVSEFNAPKEWEPIWELTRSIGVNSLSGKPPVKVDRLFK